MKESLYFDGRQIKNYLVGFASLFSEIPYKDRYGRLQEVPIHYGSPSDVISYLESNVDNAATANRNRLKDITIPMFSFRMTGIERNTEKRRDPHSTITVDLRPLGYTVGYVAMRPAPYKFTMELVCWASSDYQAFEITEQIIPYFNSPQQVTIEPLPRCPVSTTEIFLDSVEIDTEPESQKYSALVTMTFSLTGYILTQPKIWSTNMSFELNMLSGDAKNGYENTSDTTFSLGTEIVDLNSVGRTMLPNEDKFGSLEGFIRNTPAVLAEYGEKLDLYKLLLENDRINTANEIIDPTDLVYEYKGLEKTINLSGMELIVGSIEDIGYVYANEQIQEFMKSQSLEGNLKVIEKLFEDTTDTLDIYIKLLDNNLATKGFNSTGVQISNSEKMAIYGTPRVDIEDNLTRLRNYLAALENLKINKDTLAAKGVFSKKYSVYVFDTKIPYENLPIQLSTLVSETYLIENKALPKIDYTMKTELDGSLSITTTEPEITFIRQQGENISIEKIKVDKKISIPADEIILNTAQGFVIATDDSAFEIQGFIVVDLDDAPDYRKLIFDIFNMDLAYNIGKYKENEIDFYLDDKLYQLFSDRDILDKKFKDLDEFIVSSLVYKQMQEKYIKIDDMTKIIESKYGMNTDDIIIKANQLKQLLNRTKMIIDITNTALAPVDGSQVVAGQQTFSADLAQALAIDNNGKVIFDVNRDGYIDQEDLKLLGADVDNPEEFDYELKYGIWYKRFRIENMSEERIKKVIADLKILFYLTEKDDVSEIYDYLFLYEKGLVVKSYDLYPIENVQKRKEVSALGYDISILEDKLLFMKMFVESLKNIMVNERAFLLYKVPDMNESSKEMLYQEEGLDLDKIVIGKYIEKYLNSLTDFDDRMIKEEFFRNVLPESLGEYYNYIYKFNLMIKDIQTAGVFIDSLDAETTWLDDNLPEVREKIESKYK